MSLDPGKLGKGLVPDACFILLVVWTSKVPGVGR